MNDLLRLKLANSKDLPTLPAIAAKIVELANDPAATADDIALCISTDPALAAKLMRFANSPMYTRNMTCNTLAQAITFLGMKATLMIALSFSVFTGLEQQQSRGLDIDLYWRRCLLSAAAGRVLAIHSPEQINADEVFLACLLQDIGILALNAALPKLYSQVHSFQGSHELLISYENIHLKANHACVGAWLLEQWHIPTALTRCVELSHNPETLAKSGNDLAQARCVALSGFIADAYLAPKPEESLLKTIELAREYWSVGEGWIDSLIDEMAVEVPIVEQLFEMTISDASTNDNLLQAASDLTGQLSLECYQP